MKKIGTFQSKEWGTVVALRATYQGPDGPTAVVLQGEDGEPLTTLSVNLDGSEGLPPNCFYMKDWTENAEIAAEAKRSGLFKYRDDIPTEQSGFVTADAWEIVA